MLTIKMLGFTLDVKLSKNKLKAKDIPFLNDKPKEWKNPNKLSVIVRQFAVAPIYVLLEHGSTYRDALEKARWISDDLFRFTRIRYLSFAPFNDLHWKFVLEDEWAEKSLDDKMSESGILLISRHFRKRTYYL